jgi:hypothetical protein
MGEKGPANPRCEPKKKGTRSAAKTHQLNNAKQKTCKSLDSSSIRFWGGRYLEKINVFKKRNSLRCAVLGLSQDVILIDR